MSSLFGLRWAPAGAHRDPAVRRGARARVRGRDRRAPPRPPVQRPVGQDGHADDRSPAVLDGLQPSLATVLCVAGLSVLAAAIAGAVPAFRVTGRWRRTGFVGLGNRSAGARLGKTWTALLATQVALSLAILPSAMEMLWGVFRPTIVGPGLPVEEFLTASLVMEGDSSRSNTLKIEAVRRLTSEAGISGVTASAVLLLEEPSADIEVEGSEAQDAQAQFNSVDDKFFEVFGVRFLAGRSFDASDFGPGRAPVIVNDRSSHKSSARRTRWAAASATRDGTHAAKAPPPGWHEIVGVVEDFPVSNDEPTMFHPMTSAPHPVSLTIRAPSGIGPAAGRLRASPAGSTRSFASDIWNRSTRCTGSGGHSTTCLASCWAR